MRDVACHICGATLADGPLFGCFRCGKVQVCLTHVVAWVVLGTWLRRPLCGRCTSAVAHGPLADLLRARA
jgi:hypothetical protein